MQNSWNELDHICYQAFLFHPRKAQVMRILHFMLVDAYLEDGTVMPKIL